MDLVFDDKFKVNTKEDGSLQLEFQPSCGDATQKFKMSTSPEGVFDIEYQKSLTEKFTYKSDGDDFLIKPLVADPANPGKLMESTAPNAFGPPAGVAKTEEVNGKNKTSFVVPELKLAVNMTETHKFVN